MSGLRLPLVLTLGLVFALAVPLQATSAPSDVLDAIAEKDVCSEPRGAAALPQPGDADLDARLEALFAAYADLPHFIDVHYLPRGAVPFVALFEGSVPPAAHDVRPAEPVVLEAIPAPQTVPATETAGPSELAATPGLNDLICTGIRPGARITIGNAICSLAFVYTDGNRVYASTAGHCINAGQRARITGAGAFGTAIYSTGDGGLGNDFALIEVDTDKHHLVDPAMCGFGGPERENFASILGMPLYQNGHGAGLVDVPPRPKAGVGGSWGVRTFSWFGATVPGDSGSGIQTASGGALGVVTHLGIAPFEGFGNNFGSRATTMLDDAGYGHLTLMTAPLEV